MATKTMNVGVDAYHALAALKQPGESFTDVILRIAKPQVRLSSLAGLLSDEEADRMKRDMAESRKRSRERSNIMDAKLRAAFKEAAQQDRPRTRKSQ